MKKQFNISIPKPCHEDWSKMTLKEKGRFCSSCSKTVVDFTKKSKEEIQQYLSENYGKRVCGHFNRKQLSTFTLEIPSITFKQQLSFQKLFILALLFVMGTTLFSCQYSSGEKQKIENVILIDSLENTEVITDSLGTVEPNKQVVDSVNIMMGEIPTLPVLGKITAIQGDINLTEVVSEIEPIEDLIVGLLTIEDPPRFKEARKLSKADARKYFNKRMKKFVSKRLKAPQASIELPAGKYRIYAQFIIDTSGKVIDIEVKAPNASLKKQVEKIIYQLPRFIPGKQNGMVVKTRYLLPLRIDVE